MAEIKVEGAHLQKVKALALNPEERAALVLAVGDAIAGGVSRSRECWPSADDMRVLKRLSRRLWVSLGVSA